MEGVTKKVLVSIAGAVLFLSAATVQAQGIVPCTGLGDDPCTVNDLFKLLANIFNFLIGMSAVVAILMMVLSGFRMLIAYWGENPESDLRGAKETLRRAIFGLIIILTAYLVINTVLGILGAGPLQTFFSDFGG